MTTNVSIRVPDGIVVASDSLASSLVAVQQQFQLRMKCGNCGHDNPSGPIQTPPIAIPGSSTPLANKLFYVGNFGMACYGASTINGRSLFNHLMVYRTTQYRDGMTLHEVADAFASVLDAAIAQDPVMKGAPNGNPVGGFQISGYDTDDIDTGKTSIVDLHIGQKPVRQDTQSYGLTVTGNAEIAEMLASGPQKGASSKPNCGRMTIPDAIDYARFLVQTTSDYHRFADMVPTVGGPTEIALITKWIGFRWIERKKILGDDTTRLNIGKVSHEIGQIRRDLPDIIRKSREPSPDQGVEP